MDSLLHATRKIMIERARNLQSQTQAESDIPEVAPPAYSEVDEMRDSEDEIDDPSPITLTLNAETNVQGQGNLIASPALADATRFSALLLAAIQSLNAKAEAERQMLINATQNDSADSSAAGDGVTAGKAETNVKGFRPVLNVNLVINCGISVVGDKNVVGFRPQGVAGRPLPSPAIGAGVKRKAEEHSEGPTATARRIEDAE
ncbi:hypothetical protein AAFC00_005320 [Neodothiora populina]|uniref:Uncharacterized protein n=1 Tax=Neodothiora populina TaxID=2781224 RepID=A0ABR3PKG9_9PEZI